MIGQHDAARKARRAYRCLPRGSAVVAICTINAPIPHRKEAYEGRADRKAICFDAASHAEVVAGEGD